MCLGNSIDKPTTRDSLCGSRRRTMHSTFPFFSLIFFYILMCYCPILRTIFVLLTSASIFVHPPRLGNVPSVVSAMFFLGNRFPRLLIFMQIFPTIRREARSDRFHLGHDLGREESESFKAPNLRVVSPPFSTPKGNPHLLLGLLKYFVLHFSQTLYMFLFFPDSLCVLFFLRFSVMFPSCSTSSV
jgi:hypothetical protein